MFAPPPPPPPDEDCVGRHHVGKRAEAILDRLAEVDPRVREFWERGRDRSLGFAVRIAAKVQVLHIVLDFIEGQSSGSAKEVRAVRTVLAGVEAAAAWWAGGINVVESVAIAILEFLNAVLDALLLVFMLPIDDACDDFEFRVELVASILRHLLPAASVDQAARAVVGIERAGKAAAEQGLAWVIEKIMGFIKLSLLPWTVGTWVLRKLGFEQEAQIAESFQELVVKVLMLFVPGGALRWLRGKGSALLNRGRTVAAPPPKAPPGAVPGPEPGPRPVTPPETPPPPPGPRPGPSEPTPAPGAKPSSAAGGADREPVRPPGSERSAPPGEGGTPPNGAGSGKRSGGGRPRAQGSGHAKERHGPNRDSRWNGKSQFDSERAIDDLIEESNRHPGVTQPNGNTAITFDAGREIGFDRNAGRRTSTVTVITRPDGRVVTAFPGEP
jgi:hypothetical protein